MVQLFKHNYFKYFLLVILALKGVYFVAENINYTADTQICFQPDTDDFDSETEDSKELDENEQINQTSLIFYHFNKNKTTSNHIEILKEYRIRYLEFTTPPPKFI